MSKTETLIKADALVESKTLRESYMDHEEVLDKVKALETLPGDIVVSVEMAADYFEVGKETVNSLIKDNRDELAEDGLKVLTGDELMSLKDIGLIGKRTAAFTVIPKRAVLRMAMLLRGSHVARSVRSYLLDKTDQTAPPADGHLARIELFRAAIEHEERLSIHEMKIADLERKVETKIILDSRESRLVQKSVATRVYAIDHSREARAQLFREIYREIKDRWGVPSYRDVKQVDLPALLAYIKVWQPKVV